MKLASTLLALCVYVAGTPMTNAFFFGRKTDCSMSSWSPWSEPFGFQLVTRERAVLRYPTKGGKPCPTDLIDTKSTNKTVTLNAVAISVNTKFIRRQGQTLNGKPVGEKRDLLIIIDASGSIGKTDFKDALEQIARLLGLLCPVPDPFSRNYQQAAVIKYSSRVVEIFDFDDKSNSFQVKSAIRNIKYMGQRTCTAKAFKKAEDMLDVSKGMRTDPDVKQEVLILTDGKSNCGGNAIQAAKSLQNKATVFGLMIGSFSQAGQQEVISYVSGPIDQHIFAIQSFRQLKTLVNYVGNGLNQPGAPPCASFDKKQHRETLRARAKAKLSE